MTYVLFCLFQVFWRHTIAFWEIVSHWNQMIMQISYEIVCVMTEFYFWMNCLFTCKQTISSHYDWSFTDVLATVYSCRNGGCYFCVYFTDHPLTILSLRRPLIKYCWSPAWIFQQPLWDTFKILEEGLAFIALKFGFFISFENLFQHSLRMHKSVKYTLDQYDDWLSI